MDINALIAGLGSNFRPVDDYMQGAQFKQQNALNQLQMDKYKQEEETKNALMQLANQYAIAAPEAQPLILNKMAAYSADPFSAFATMKKINAPEYDITEIGTPGGRFQKAYVSKRPGDAPIPIGVPYIKSAQTQVNVGGEPFKVPTGYMRDPTNPMGVAPIPGGPEDPRTKTPKFSEGELQSAQFANRMIEAARRMEGLTGSGFDPAQPVETAKSKIPLVGNFMVSPDFQAYRQAQEDWVRAKLRKESGAAIGKDEMEKEISTYFPQVGDSAEVKAQKEAARAEAEQGMRVVSQGAYEKNFAKKQSGVSASPKLGTVVDGYVYRGGDPANPNSWKKAR